MLMSRIWICLGLLSWAAAVGGAAAMANIPGDWGHGLCGPWGCAPPLQALVSCHLIWCLVLFPLAVLAAGQLSHCWLHRLGVMLLAAGLGGVLMLAMIDLFTWWPHVPDVYRRYFAHRCLFQVATLVDVPLTQTAVAGLALCLVARWRRT